MKLLTNDDAGLRYWGVIGLLTLGKTTDAEQVALQAVLNDKSGDVAAMAAWALIRSGATETPRSALNMMLMSHSPASLTALNVIDWAGLEVAPFADGMAALEGGRGPMHEYEQRMVTYLRGKLSGRR